MVSEGIFINGEKVTFNPENILNGDVSAYTEAIGEATQDWLDEHLEPGGSVPIDDTLTIAGAAADAKKTGDEISDLKEDLSNIDNEIAEAAGVVKLTSLYADGYIATHTSTIDISATHPTYTAGKYIVVEVAEGDVFQIKGHCIDNMHALWAWAKSDGTKISYSGNSSVTYADYTEIVAPADAKYLVSNVYLDAPYGLVKGEFTARTVQGISEAITNWNLYIDSTASDGYIMNTGALHAPTASGDRTSDFIPVSEGDVLNLRMWASLPSATDRMFVIISTYNDSKGFITRVTKQEAAGVEFIQYTYTVPSGVSYVRVGGRTFGNAKTILTIGSYDIGYVPAWEDFARASLTSRVSALEILSKSGTGLLNPLLRPSKPRMILHRGLNSEAPENTIPAFELAGQGGAWGIETDVYETTDGYFVLSHDNDVSRMTDGTGNITEMTYAQTQECTIDAGSNIEQYPNLKMPLLEDYLAICRRYGCIACIEIKGVTNYDNLINTVKSCGMEGSSVYLVPYDATVITTIRELTSAPILIVGTSGTDVNTLIQNVSSYADIWFTLYSTTVTAETVKSAHASNIPVGPWTINSSSSVITRIGQGCDYITTDSITRIE